MTIRIERSIDDPIVTFIFEGALDPMSLQNANAQAVRLLRQMGVFYAVLDIRGMEITSGEAIALLKSLEKAGSRVKFVFIGRPISHDPTKQHKDPVFMSKDEALEYVLKDIAANAPNTQKA